MIRCDFLAQVHEINIHVIVQIFWTVQLKKRKKGCTITELQKKPKCEPRAL